MNLLKANRFKIINYKTEKVKYPVMDLIIRFLNKFNILKISSDFYCKHKLLRRFRKIKLSVIGYRRIDVIVKKKV